MVRIWLHQPNGPVFVGVEKFQIVCGIHLPRPDDFRVFDIRRVIDPFPGGIVREAVSDDHQLFAGVLFQLVFDAGSLGAEMPRSGPHECPVGRGPFRSLEIERPFEHLQSGKHHAEDHCEAHQH